jgi:hypothetical protein
LGLSPLVCVYVYTKIERARYSILENSPSFSSFMVSELGQLMVARAAVRRLRLVVRRLPPRSPQLLGRSLCR